MKPDTTTIKAIKTIVQTRIDNLDKAFEQIERHRQSDLFMEYKSRYNAMRNELCDLLEDINELSIEDEIYITN